MEPDNKKVMSDVEKPGLTPAHATSRPLITSRGPAVKDPMVSNDTGDKVPGEPARQAPSVTKKKIEPLATQTQESVKEDSPVKPDDLAENQIETPISEELGRQNAEEAAAAAKVALSKEELEQEKLVIKLAEEKKYFVPIGAAKKRRTARTTMFLTGVLLLILAGGVLAVDAGIVETDIALPFDLIKSASK